MVVCAVFDSLRSLSPKLMQHMLHILLCLVNLVDCVVHCDPVSAARQSLTAGSFARILKHHLCNSVPLLLLLA